MCKCNKRVFLETRSFSFCRTRCKISVILVLWHGCDDFPAADMMKATAMRDGPYFSKTLSARAWILALVLCGSVARAETAWGAVPDTWLIDACAASCRDAPESLRYRRLDEWNQWRDASAEEFQAANDSTVPPIVYLHGNRTNLDQAVTKAWYVREVIRGAAPGRAFRVVIWAWPAEPMARSRRKDARLKAAFCDAESVHLALWLTRLNPEVRVSLVGHSFGPRIIAGALHLLGGGDVAGRCISEDAVKQWNGEKKRRVRAVMLAAAVDAGALLPGQRYGSALSGLEGMLVTRNGCDRALRHYPKLEGCGTNALGAVGPCPVSPDDPIEVIDVVQQAHNWRAYASAPGVCRRWGYYTFLDEDPPSNDDTRDSAS